MDEFNASFDRETLEAFLGRMADRLGGDLRSDRLQAVLQQILVAPVGTAQVVIARTHVQLNGRHIAILPCLVQSPFLGRLRQRRPVPSFTRRGVTR